MNYRYFNPNEKAFTIKPPVPEKILVDNIETDNPEFLKVKRYTLEEAKQILQKAFEEGKDIVAGEGYDYALKEREKPSGFEEAKRQILKLKSNLSATDYQAIKFAEGELSAEDYADMKSQRAAWRKEINELEQTFGIKSVFGG